MHDAIVKLRNWRAWPLLWKMLVVAIAIHLLIGLLTIPGFLFGRGESLDDQYARGQQLITTGRYAEAMDLFQHILDQQPKPAPIFEKAAQQHQLAERLAKQAMETPATTQATAMAAAAPTTTPANTNVPAQSAPQRTDLSIPPELRGQ